MCVIALLQCGNFSSWGNRMRTNWRLAAALTWLTAVLVGCGGGTEGAAVTTAAPEQMQRWVQPADAVQDVPSIQLRLQDSALLPTASSVKLGPLMQTQAAATAEVGVPLLIGAARDVPATATSSATQQQFKWKTTASGGQVGAISFAAEGAKGLRLGVLVKQLPGGAVLRVYSQAKPGEVFQISGQEVLQRIDANVRAGDNSEEAHTWWTPDLSTGSESTLEIELPAGVATQTLDIAVPRLSHVFVDLQALTEGADALQAIGDAQTCNLDANCYSDLVSERNAVARMLFVQGGLSYLCTGTLLNDRFSTGTPYFLTANHCISTQTVASTLQTDWFYRSSSCRSGVLSAASTKRTGGATLLYASGSTDTAFMRLNDTPPAGATFAGWDSNAVVVNAAISSLHHPRGDLLKYTTGSVSGLYNCDIGSETFTCTAAAAGNFMRVGFSQGITEGGSSGSSIFRGGYVVGTLTGGASSCSAGVGSGYGVYGRFDVPYKAALNRWLWPQAAATRTSIYRFYNTATGAHFFTSSAAERDSVIANLKTFNYEGTAFYAYDTQVTDSSPVFRFYNPRTAAHFFTISADERDWVQRTYPFFQYEGPSWYAQTAGSNGATAMYRFYLPKTGTHFYTISAAERDYVIQSLKEYQYEGTGYYAWTSQ